MSHGSTFSMKELRHATVYWYVKMYLVARLFSRSVRIFRLSSMTDVFRKRT